MRRLVFVLILVLALPAAVQASDIVATYKYSDGSMVTMVTRDKNHVRMDTSANSYMLLSGGKVYSVNCEDGQCRVMDMGAMMNSSVASMFGGGGDAADYTVRYEKTGKTETVAGYKGTVYEAITFEDGKQVSRDEMVLSNHTNLKKLTEAWIALAEVMTQTMGDSFKDSLEEAKTMGYGGMLRHADHMRLHKLSIKNIDSSYYKLPSGSQQVQMQQPPQQPTQQPAPLPTQQQQQSSTDVLEDDAKDIGDSARQDTKDEIKNAIGNAIGDLFN